VYIWYNFFQCAVILFWPRFRRSSVFCFSWPIRFLFSLAPHRSCPKWQLLWANWRGRSFPRGRDGGAAL